MPVTQCNTMQHNATQCNTLQHAATRCKTLQHAATNYATLQHTAHEAHDCDVSWLSKWRAAAMDRASLCCHMEDMHFKTLQHTATHRNTPQHTARCYHTLPASDHMTRNSHGPPFVVSSHHMDNTCTSTRCSTLQHPATRCNTLQHTATHRLRLIT